MVQWMNSLLIFLVWPSNWGQPIGSWESVLLPWVVGQKPRAHLCNLYWDWGPGQLVDPLGIQETVLSRAGWLKRVTIELDFWGWWWEAVLCYVRTLMCKGLSDLFLLSEPARALTGPDSIPGYSKHPSYPHALMKRLVQGFGLSSLLQLKVWKNQIEKANS